MGTGSVPPIPAPVHREPPARRSEPAVVAGPTFSLGAEGVPASLGAADQTASDVVRRFGAGRPASAPTGGRSRLTVGAADDPLEREADRVAAEVVRRFRQPRADASIDSPLPSRGASAVARSVVRRAATTSVIDAAGGQLDAATGAAIGRARGSGRPLDDIVRRSMEDGFGADFSAVRVHTDSTAHALNEQLSAKAFTTGNDIFFRRGEYRPADAAGQHLLAHELTHTVQQSGDGVQRAWHPATTTKNAHLRNDGVWDTKIGDRIDKGSEVVVDRADTETDVKQRLILGEKSTDWVKAVDETAADFDPATHGAAATFIRGSSIGPDKDYGAKGLPVNEADHKPPRRRAARDLALKWLPTVGEYVTIEESVSHVGSPVVHRGNDYKRLDGGQLHDLDAEELLQLDTTETRKFFRDKVVAILKAENTGTPWENLLATDANAEKIIASNDAAKALRIDDFQDSSGPMYVSWFKWAIAADGPLSRIRTGAREVNESLTHWQTTMFPSDSSRVGVTKLELTGSDLHEFGLGAMFVTFTKPKGGPADYDAAGPHEVVIKPEARVLEHALFGTQADSLANEVNRIVGLAPNDQITTYKQIIDAKYGTMCEKVLGTSAKKLPGPATDLSQGMKEALIFVMLTGLSDQHFENVLWKDDRPYMIDADNALKLKFMTTDTKTTKMQNGFVAYTGAAKSDATMKGVMSGAKDFETSILEELKNPSSAESRTLLLKVRDTFSGKVGRTVPIETASWGSRLTTFIATPDVGAETDKPDLTAKQQTTRWKYCHMWANWVRKGGGNAQAPGLEGEVGMANGTDGNFDVAEEARQIFADFKVGQIPFYNYRYTDGKVLHNHAEIWDGQPIGERMSGLFALFPNQDTA